MIPDIGNVTVNNAEIPLVGIGNILSLIHI